VSADAVRGCRHAAVLAESVTEFAEVVAVGSNDVVEIDYRWQVGRLKMGIRNIVMPRQRNVITVVTMLTAPRMVPAR
jgi:hypothetical protein